ncbi:MAG: methyl-accepting chemotaxis protein [Burkholderiaceae bacterium]
MFFTPLRPDASATAWPRWLRPGQHLMRRLRLGGKLLLLLAATVPTMSLLALHEITEAYHRVGTVDAERAGADQARRVLQLAARVNDQRVAIARLAPGQTDSAARHAAGRELTAALANVDAVLPATSIAGQMWQHERQLLQQLAAEAPDMSRRARLAAHEERAQGLQLLLLQIGEQSMLTFDGAPATNLLADTALSFATRWMTTLGELHGAGLMLAQGVGVASDPARAQLAVQRLRQATEQLNMRQRALARHHAAPPSSADTLHAAMNTLADRADALLLVHDEPATARAFDEAALHAEAALARWLDDGWSLCERLLLEQRQTTLHTTATIVSVLAACALLMAYFALAFTTSIGESLQQLCCAVRRVASGNLLQPVQLRGRDELATLGATLEGTMVRLSAMVGEIRSSAVRVDEAGSSVAVDGKALATRTDDQSQMLRRAQHALTDMSAAVNRHETTAAALHELAGALRDSAERGNTSMEGTVAAMATLEDSVRRVAEVNAVIDDLAFQTNMLALNASVEASRAGESGRGFAVVAGEIRQLAHRCAEAAAEVRQLIEATTEQAALSKQSIDDARAQLRAVGDGVHDVAQRMRDVTGVGEQQRERTQQLAEVVGQLGALTRRNADAADKASQAAQTMAHQAAALRASVAATRLRRGTADEARALVERAVAHIAEVGWNRAVRSFNEATGHFVDRDMYIFALDAEGRYLAFGADPSLVGKLASERRDITEGIVERFMQAARAAVAQGQGWIDYSVPGPDGEGEVAKSAYIVALDEGAFIGCGVVREAVDPAAGRAAMPELTAAA